MPEPRSQDSRLFLEERSVTDMIFTRLREAILNGTFKPGERLRQEDLAAQFGGSRIPVREALHRLAAGGLVALRPQRGAVVSGFSLEEIPEIYEIRAALDGLVTAMATPRVGTEDLAKLEDILAQMEALVHEGDVRVWSQLDEDFHFTLYRASGRRQFLQMIENQYHHSKRYIYLAMTLSTGREGANVGHRAVFEAIRRRDASAARQAMEEHLLTMARLLTDYIQGKLAEPGGVEVGGE